ncbi:MAG: N-6 DNA methylase, partial [Chloroflexi bacterium]|nr:N-6 DNA methylase [Chloroflexota bacterium]
MNTPVHSKQPPQSEFLEAVYVQLNYQAGDLLDTVDTSQVHTVDPDQWLEKGNWLELGKKINAEKIFFVNNDPIIVFRAFTSLPDKSEVLTAFRQAWCMTRPQYLFLAFPGELRVYGLRQSPRQHKDLNQQLTCETINRIADVSVKLKDYRREQLEAGYFPQDEHFGKADEQADKRLIKDLKEVRKQLRAINDLDPKFAHALIGRSIFVRYLEDRKVLLPTYFEQVAAKHQRDDWLGLLGEPPPQLLIQDKKWQERRYYQVLQDKDFTYALFEQLAEDFNGDLFPKDAAEERAVTITHLETLRKYLLGDPDPRQPTLWLWAYDFEIVPIELISSIYEEFYKNEQDDPGTHYTPSVLVEFVLSQVLPTSYLDANPTLQILDPACGSGIFLVEAYRRLVRYRIQETGGPLDSVALREILRDQIRGIELNKNATYVAAFSLYLALLHYQEPSDILAQIEFPQPDNKPLPHLIYNADQVGLPNQYGVLFNCNAFALTNAERAQLQAKLEAHPLRTTLKRFLDTSDDLPIEANSVDVIVGNPPWGFVSKNKATPEIAEAQEKAKEWCQRFGWSIGDYEQSQAFIARSFGLLAKYGACGLLVSTGVFWKGQSKSQEFRQRWLQQCTIKTVTNFAHVRHIFFEKADSPFAVVHYIFLNVSPSHYIQYWSAKRTEIIEDKPRVILHLSDLKRVRQVEIQNNEWLWKTHWWGNHRDVGLISILRLDNSLNNLIEKNGWFSGTGFKGKIPSEKPVPSDWLKNFPELPKAHFHRYGQVNKSKLVQSPDEVNRNRDPLLFEGWRLLVKRGIDQKNNV